MIVDYKKLHPNAIVPAFKTDGAAAFDLASVSSVRKSWKTRVYDTGIAMAIPNGYYVDVNIRSGTAFSDDFILANGTGIIDSDYRGPIELKLTYIGPGNEPDWPEVGDRIAQGMLKKKIKTTFNEVSELDETQRGENGFGSTGK